MLQITMSQYFTASIFITVSRIWCEWVWIQGSVIDLNCNIASDSCKFFHCVSIPWWKKNIFINVVLFHKVFYPLKKKIISMKNFHTNELSFGHCNNISKQFRIFLTNTYLHNNVNFGIISVCYVNRIPTSFTIRELFEWIVADCLDISQPTTCCISTCTYTV